jgi:hypothetical protein
LLDPSCHTLPLQPQRTLNIPLLQHLSLWDTIICSVSVPPNLWAADLKFLISFVSQKLTLFRNPKVMEWEDLPVLITVLTIYCMPPRSHLTTVTTLCLAFLKGELECHIKFTSPGPCGQ